MLSAVMLNVIVLSVVVPAIYRGTEPHWASLGLIGPLWASLGLIGPFLSKVQNHFSDCVITNYVLSVFPGNPY
jgi:hypothetical protein